MMCLLLGAAGTGKTLLAKRLQKLSTSDDVGDLGDIPPTLSTVGTNLTDLVIQKRKITVRELGGCMGPIWPSYYRDCSSVMFVIDAANPTQVSASCIQLLSVLSANPLATACVLILFNKIDLPCYMSLLELKSLFRLNDIISCAKQPITVLEVSARDGTGLPAVLQWLHTACGDRLATCRP
ncbi:ADP-ribosylation factor-like protein 16 [Microcaecilia unicolor]|uniref:ADP-ribosylation factor-like protein 16 n=1 Tax=Microcaecilia unicolor TaxID=1415580 RepID=A0A6P7YHV5_9AMPH|nr:ADP-ribosylation factor-like protein 16 [Microcaecilia unicolor]